MLGFFHKRKQAPPSADWSQAYTAKPHFYETPDGTPFGAIALTEETETILPKAPQRQYQVDGQPVEMWKLVLVSTKQDCIIGECDYARALKKLERYALDTQESTFLIKKLSLNDLEALLEA